MSAIDWAIAAVVLFGIGRGFFRGAVRTAFSLLAWFVALLAATRFSGALAGFFVGVVDSAPLQTAAAFAAVFLLALAALKAIAFGVLQTLKTLKLDFLDRLLGGALGGALGVLKVLVALSLLAPLLVLLPAWHSSTLAQSLMPFAPTAKRLVFETFGKAWQQIDKRPSGE